MPRPGVPASPEAPVPGPHVDRELARRVLEGSREAWHEFLHRYTRLIDAVLRQQLPFETGEEREQLRIDVLHDLYRGRLAQYGGRASLSTWLVVVVRGLALDHLRHRLGRRRAPAGYRRLGPFERRVFQLYYVEWLSHEAVVAALDWEDGIRRPGRVAAALGLIEEVLDRRFLDRARWDRAAALNGADSGYHLEYLQHVREEYAAGCESQSPECAVIDAEQRSLLSRVRDLCSGLPEVERRILALRFEHGLSAQQIALRTGVASARRVYTLLERALRGLRKQLHDAHDARVS